LAIDLMGGGADGDQTLAVFRLRILEIGKDGSLARPGDEGGFHPMSFRGGRLCV